MHHYIEEESAILPEIAAGQEADTLCPSECAAWRLIVLCHTIHLSMLHALFWWKNKCVCVCACVHTADSQLTKQSMVLTAQLPLLPRFKKFCLLH